jgi:hypothetical protein
MSLEAQSVSTAYGRRASAMASGIFSRGPRATANLGTENHLCKISGRRRLPPQVFLSFALSQCLLW